MVRTVRCTPATRSGRRRKAKQFWDVAAMASTLIDEGDDVADAYITLLVHAGIAASDVICCAKLGEHAAGESHVEAIDLLKKVDKALAKNLDTHLGMKTRSGYSHLPASADDRKKADRAAKRLVDAMAAISGP